MIAEAIARDCGLSEDEPEVCAGIIGEIGISKDFTPAEEKVLRGAARASKLSGATALGSSSGLGAPSLIACSTSSRAKARTCGTSCSAI